MSNPTETAVAPFVCVDEFHYLHTGKRPDGSTCYGSVTPRAIDGEDDDGWRCRACLMTFDEMPDLPAGGLDAFHVLPAAALPLEVAPRPRQHLAALAGLMLRRLSLAPPEVRAEVKAKSIGAVSEARREATAARREADKLLKTGEAEENAQAAAVFAEAEEKAEAAAERAEQAEADADAIGYFLARRVAETLLWALGDHSPELDMLAMTSGDDGAECAALADRIIDTTARPKPDGDVGVVARFPIQAGDEVSFDCNLEDDGRISVYFECRGRQVRIHDMTPARAAFIAGGLAYKASVSGYSSLAAFSWTMADLCTGAQVECVDDRDGAGFLYVGEVYTVDSLQTDSDGQLRLNLVGMARAWEVGRFKKPEKRSYPGVD